MPAFYEPHDDYMGAVQQIILSSSETDYLDQLVPVMRDIANPQKASQLMQTLSHASAERESDIERICNSNHQDFVNSVKQLQHVREGTMVLTSEIMNLSQSIETSTEKLAQQKKALVDSRGVRQKIDETSQALKDCLQVLRLSNQVHDLLAKKNHYAALRALDELKHVHLREVTRYKIAEVVEQSVPATQRMIADAVMRDLNTWLFRLREVSQFVGELAFYQTGLRRDRLRERAEKDKTLSGYRLNSAIEAVADETEEYDVLNNDDVQVDFTPLFEAIYIHHALGEIEKFRQEYAATRREQNDRLVPQRSIDLVDEEANELSSLFESIAGFAIIEKATMERTDNLRTASDVDELWESMCQKAITLITSALPPIDSDDKILRIKGVIALFIQTVNSWGYSVASIDRLTVLLFEKYSDLLERRFSEDFEEILTTKDDYMPMAINDVDEYEKVINVSWYRPGANERPQFPCVLPFSRMYPLVCIDIRDFLNQMYLFSDDHFQNASLIDDSVKSVLDKLLSEKVCKSLVDRLSSQYPGQIVQILTNLDHFESTCRELEVLLVELRSSSSAAGAIKLQATERFVDAKKKAEKRIFELVDSKIDDLVETAEYDWLSTSPPDGASLYMSELTRYLQNIMTSVLLGLPAQIKELIYFDALSHISSAILRLPLDASVARISPDAVRAYQLDVDHLVSFVSNTGDANLLAGLEELRQTKNLMVTAADPNGRVEEEFFDAERSRKRFSKVDRASGAELLEKVGQGVLTLGQGASGTGAAPNTAVEKKGMNFSNFSSRFQNMNMNLKGSG